MDELNADSWCSKQLRLPCIRIVDLGVSLNFMRGTFIIIIFSSYSASSTMSSSSPAELSTKAFIHSGSFNQGCVVTHKLFGHRCSVTMGYEESFDYAGRKHTGWCYDMY